MAKILVAEDESDIRELIAYSLIHIGGFEVVKARNGVEAVAVAKEELPDLILMDVRMPNMTGVDACAALKESPATENIPVVFLSAMGQEQEIRQGMDVGAVEYILKPFAPDALLQKVRDILSRYDSA
jgi:two-component system, OmpR family, alkaline phosphatase synthesis response regulator PhoP